MHKVIKESVSGILHEIGDKESWETGGHEPSFAYKMGAVDARRDLRGDKRSTDGFATLEKDAVENDDYWLGYNRFIKNVCLEYIKEKGFGEFLQSIADLIFDTKDTRELKSFMSSYFPCETFKATKKKNHFPYVG